MTSTVAPRTVSVVGHGGADATPDAMRVELGVDCFGDTVADALASANGAARALTDALGGAGVASRDLQTSGLSVHPRFGDHSPDGAPIVGYEASHNVTAVLRDLDSAPSILGAAAEAGGDATRITNVSMIVSDETEAAVAARDAAYADALARARQYAHLAGYELGPVVSASETPPGRERPPVVMAARSSVPVHAGSTTVTASIAVVFALA
ncbi:SIMPL domain-containing protein [Gordonia humi]|uniref:DUF541 domain-containing protein n=1 Tax=Gordonia humi TaxID=686429 RepID=A0A840EXD7_9ACTN|nr:hypothetical protein [Gordonia humi]